MELCYRCHTRYNPNDNFSLTCCASMTKIKTVHVRNSDEYSLILERKIGLMLTSRMHKTVTVNGGLYVTCYYNRIKVNEKVYERGELEDIVLSKYYGSYKTIELYTESVEDLFSCSNQYDKETINDVSETHFFIYPLLSDVSINIE